ncbi:MAG: hypothetical protein R3D44_15795 [Hyphomicrobiaceae bacterium]
MADSERSKTGGDEAGQPVKRREELDQLLQRIAAHIAEVDKADDKRTGSLSAGGGSRESGAAASSGDSDEGDERARSSGSFRRQPGSAEPPALRSALGRPSDGPVRIEAPADAPQLQDDLTAVPADGGHEEPALPASEPAAKHSARAAAAAGALAGEEPWDDASAEALTRTYEAEAAVPPLRSMLNLMAGQSRESAAHAQGGESVAARSPMAANASHAEIDAAQTRLFEAARRVETMLDRLAPKDAVEALGERFHSLEDEVQRNSAQLARLDGIEERLGELGHKLTDDQVVALFGSLVPTAEDLTQFAEDAAGRAAERVLEAYARELSPSEGQPEDRGASAVESTQLKALGETLAAFMDERRRTEASTLEALETLQLAMQHLLDRVERGESHDGRADHGEHHPHEETAEASLGDYGHSRRQEPREAVEPHDDPSEGMVNLTANQGARDLAAHAYRMPEARLGTDETVPDAYGYDEAAKLPNERRAVGGEPVQTQVGADMGPAAPRMADVRPGAQSVRDMDTEAPAQPMSERQLLIARARMAAERASAEAGNGAKAQPEKASKAKAKGEPKAAAASSGIIRPGVLIVAVVTIALAGYWLVFGSKRGLPRPFASAAVERPAPRVSPPAKASGPDVETEADQAAPAQTAPETDPGARLSPNKITNEPASTMPSGDHQEASVAPSQEETTGPGMAIAFGHSPATYESVLQARERARLAGLSQRTAFAAVQTHGVPAIQQQPAAKPAVQPVAHKEAPKTTTAIETASVQVAPTSLPKSAAAQDRRQLILPPAATGPLSLRLAAAQGDAGAQLEVATRLAEGKGVRQDFAEAAKWYQHAADQGQAVAQYRLATLYERGMGVTADRSKARSLYEQAARQGNLKAMHNLAVISASPKSGTPDYNTAAGLFMRAAEHGLHDSQYNLGVLYESGLGVAKDHAAAYKWYTLAARGGDTDAARRRDMLISRLPPETLQAMDAQISAWRPAPSDETVNNARAAASGWTQKKATSRGR